jgi:hypothetical protein
MENEPDPRLKNLSDAYIAKVRCGMYVNTFNPWEGSWPPNPNNPDRVPLNDVKTELKK